jgi:hypothetical protein
MKYSKQDIDFIENNFPQNGAQFCANALKRTRSEINSLCDRRGIRLKQTTKHNILSKIRKQYKPFNKYKVNPEKFIRPRAPEEAYILGLLWADGYLNKKRGTIGISCIKLDFNEFLPSLKGMGEWRIYYKCRPNRQEIGTAETNNRPASDFLYKYNYCSKYKTATILKIIPEHLHYYWFRGLSDGDGCFYIKKNGHKSQRYSIYGPFNQDWSYVISLLASLNIRYKIRKSKHLAQNGQTHLSSRLEILQKPDIIKFGNYIYQNRENDKIGLTRKYNKYLLTKLSPLI